MARPALLPRRIDPQPVRRVRSQLDAAEGGRRGIDGQEALYQYVGVDPVFMFPQQNAAWVHTSPFFMPSRLFGGQAGVPGEFNYEGFLITESVRYYPYIPKVWVPRMALSADDVEAIAEVKTVLRAYVLESAAKFVTGRLDINNDAVWNDFVKGLDRIGLQKYLDVMNKTYERYK